MSKSLFKRVTPVKGKDAKKSAMQRISDGSGLKRVKQQQANVKLRQH